MCYYLGRGGLHKDTTDTGPCGKKSLKVIVLMHVCVHVCIIIRGVGLHKDTANTGPSGKKVAEGYDIKVCASIHVYILCALL